MKRNILFTSIILFIFCLSCGNKKDAFDTSDFYFRVKIDNQWKNYTDDAGAFMDVVGRGNNYPMVAFGGGDAKNNESMLFNFDIRVTRFGADSLPITPKMEYSFRYFEYRVNGKQVITTPQGSWSDALGKFSLNEFKVIDTTGKFAGYFKGNMSYVNEQGKTVTITEGQFNFRRNDLK